MGANIELSGMDALLSKVEDIGLKLSKVEGVALKTAAEPVLKDAQTTTAFIDRSGHLRDSLKISNIKTQKGLKFVWVGDIDKKAQYSWFVEFGHSQTSAHPFLGPAFEKNKQNITKIIRIAIEEALK